MGNFISGLISQRYMDFSKNTKAILNDNSNCPSENTAIEKDFRHQIHHSEETVPAEMEPKLIQIPLTGSEKCTRSGVQDHKMTNTCASKYGNENEIADSDKGQNEDKNRNMISENKSLLTCDAESCIQVGDYNKQTINLNPSSKRSEIKLVQVGNGGTQNAYFNFYTQAEERCIGFHNGELEDIEMRIQIRRRSGSKETSADDVENACVEALAEQLGMQIILELEETLDMKVEDIINGSVVIRLKPNSQESIRKLNMAIQNGQLQRILGRILDLGQVKSAANGCPLVLNVTTTSPVNEVDTKKESAAEPMSTAACLRGDETKVYRYRRSQRQKQKNKSDVQLQSYNAKQTRIISLIETIPRYADLIIDVLVYCLILWALMIIFVLTLYHALFCYSF